MPRNAKATQKTKATYRPTRQGAIKFRSASAKVKYLLKTTKLRQVAIAEKCGVTAACVCQLASEYR